MGVPALNPKSFPFPNRKHVMFHWMSEARRAEHSEVSGLPYLEDEGDLALRSGLMIPKIYTLNPKLKILNSKLEILNSKP